MAIIKETPITVRITSELADKVDKHAAKTGITRSVVVRRALLLFFRAGAPEDVSKALSAR